MPPDVLDTTARPAPALNATSDTIVVETPAVTPPAAEKPAAPALSTTEADSAAAKTPEEKTQEAAPADVEDDGPKDESDPKWYTQRIGKITAKMREQERAAVEANERLARAEAELQALRTPPAPTKVEPEARPSKDAFESPDAYEEAVIQWTARQEMRRVQEEDRKQAEERATKANTERAQAALTSLHNAHNERVAAAKAELPDFDKVALREDVSLRFDVFYAIEKNAMGPYVMYEIGKNPALAAELNRLEPIDAAFRIADIAQDIKARNARRVSAAPAPIEPLGGRGKAGPKSADEESMEEYATRRTKELDAERHRQRGGRRAPH